VIDDHFLAEAVVLVAERNVVVGENDTDECHGQRGVRDDDRVVGECHRVFGPEERSGSFALRPLAEVVAVEPSTVEDVHHQLGSLEEGFANDEMIAASHVLLEAAEEGGVLGPDRGDDEVDLALDLGSPFFRVVAAFERPLEHLVWLRPKLGEQIGHVSLAENHATENLFAGVRDSRGGRCAGGRRDHCQGHRD